MIHSIRVFIERIFLSTTEKKHGFDKDSLNKIEELLSAKFEKSDDSYSINIKDSKNKTSISLEILIENEGGCLISVYTSNCHLQLQSCSSFLISEMLEEVIFISETVDKLSGLIISTKGDCSLYSNVNKDILNKDFSELSSEKLLSAVALSVTESIE